MGNLEHCAKYLNQTLVTYGFPASLDLFANDPVRFGLDPSVLVLLGFNFNQNLCFVMLCRFRSRGLAIVCTRCFSRGNAMLNLETPLMSRDNGNEFQLCISLISLITFEFASLFLYQMLHL